MNLDYVSVYFEDFDLSATVTSSADRVLQLALLQVLFIPIIDISASASFSVIVWFTGGC